MRSNHQTGADRQREEGLADRFKERTHGHFTEVRGQQEIGGCARIAFNQRKTDDPDQQDEEGRHQHGCSFLDAAFHAARHHKNICQQEGSKQATNHVLVADRFTEIASRHIRKVRIKKAPSDPIQPTTCQFSLLFSALARE